MTPKAVIDLRAPEERPAPRGAGEFRDLNARTIVSGAAVIAAFASGMLRSPMPLLLIPPASAVLARRRQRRRRWAEHDAQRDAVAALCSAVRAELEAGLSPRVAFTSAVWARPELRDLAESASRPGADENLSGLLVEHARRPGRRALRAIAACWYAAERHGLSLVDALAGIEEGLRAEQARLRSAQVELAGIRATILLLAALPVFGLALGLALGADPLGTLLHRTVGQLALVCGVALELCGLLWTDRLIARLRPEECGRRPAAELFQALVRPVSRWRGERG
jgi:tight adherence protein B